MSKPLSGKVALVTGGSRGIGAAVALRLAQDGASVAIGYGAAAEAARKVVKSLEAEGVRAAAFRADQADPAAVAGLVRQVAAEFGGLDILVNNAGVFVTGPVDGPDEGVANFDRQYAINVGGVVAAVRAAAKVLRKGGRVVTVGSGIATRVGFTGLSD